MDAGPPALLVDQSRAETPEARASPSREDFTPPRGLLIASASWKENSDHHSRAGMQSAKDLRHVAQGQEISYWAWLDISQFSTLGYIETVFYDDSPSRSLQ